MIDSDLVIINHLTRFQIKDIKDDVEYYIESNKDPDFMENETMYDDIDGLEEMLLDNVRIFFLFHLLTFY